MKTSKTSADALIFQPASSMTFTVNYRTTKDRAVLRSKYKFDIFGAQIYVPGVHSDKVDPRIFASGTDMV